MKIKFAVVGCGHIGMRHAEMIQRNEEAELVALIDVKEKKALNIKDDRIPFFSGLSEFLNSGIEADVISIATPNGYHASQALECLDAGKHVLIEKPMALSAGDAQQIIDKAAVAGKKVFTVMQNRYSPPSVWIKDLIRSNALGELYFVQLNCFWNRDERYYVRDSWHGHKDLDGGTLFTQFSHFIDIMYWLFGDIRNIQAKFSDFNHHSSTDFEDSGFINFDFVKEGKGQLNYSTSVWNRNLESSMTIIAENGSVKIGGQYMNQVEHCEIKDYIMPVLAPANPANDYGYYKGSAQNHHFVIENIIDVLNDRAMMTTRPEEGLKVVEIIEKIYSLK